MTHNNEYKHDTSAIACPHRSDAVGSRGASGCGAAGGSAAGVGVSSTLSAGLVGDGGVGPLAAAGACPLGASWCGGRCAGGGGGAPPRACWPCCRAKSIWRCRIWACCRSLAAMMALRDRCIRRIMNTCRHARRISCARYWDANELAHW